MFIHGFTIVVPCCGAEFQYRCSGPTKYCNFELL